MKILHVTNIAQNAYINSIVLEQAGHECDVLAFDLYHFAASPEWYELFDVDTPPNIAEEGYFPNFYSLSEGMPVIGDNVAHGPMFNALVYLDLRRRSHPLAETALCVLRYLRFKCTMLKTTTPFAIKWPVEEFEACLGRYRLPQVLHQAISAGRIVDEVLEFIRSRLMRFNSRDGVLQISTPIIADRDSPLAAAKALDPYLAEFLTPLQANGTLYALGLEAPAADRMDLSALSAIGPAAELEPFQDFGPLWRDLHAAYDVVIFYGDSSLFAVTNGILGYCALEHGTIRTIPFEDSTYGRLLAEGYRRADKVFVTNTDYVTNERRLEFASGQLVYLPHPFDEQRAFSFKANFRAPARAGDIVKFLCPARQDWRSRDPKMAKGNDSIFHAARSLLDRGIGNFHLTCIAWGVDLQASIGLCAELGLTEKVSWIPPMTKRQLWEEMLSSDCVIDQFLISVVSGITFEALALGRRLICRDDGIANKVFFGSVPPILSASTPDDIAARMSEVIADPDDSAAIGEACMAWVAKYHSAKRNTGLQMAAFADVIERKSKAQHSRAGES